MTRRTPTACLAVPLLLVAASPASVPAGDQTVFRAEVNSVAVTVSVLRNGRPVPSLTARDFEVFDAGTLQEVSDLSYERMPIDITLVVDLSGSITKTVLETLTGAVDDVQRQLRPGDRAGLLTFNHRIREIAPIDDGAPAFPRALGPADGGTSLVDAATLAIVAPADPSRRRLVVIFTDGQDTTSFTEGQAVVEIARRRDAAVFAVALWAGMPSAGARGREALVQALTRATGGRLEVLKDRAELGASFHRAIEEFRGSYLLHYTYRGPDVPGWHDLAVRVLRPGVDVRARQGYAIN
jgi:Ca-activated chloride channel family protein